MISIVRNVYIKLMNKLNFVQIVKQENYLLQHEISIEGTEYYSEARARFEQVGEHQ